MDMDHRPIDKKKKKHKKNKNKSKSKEPISPEKQAAGNGHLKSHGSEVPEENHSSLKNAMDGGVANVNQFKKREREEEWVSEEEEPPVEKKQKPSPPVAPAFPTPSSSSNSVGAAIKVDQKSLKSSES